MIRDEVIKAIERRAPRYVPLVWFDQPEWSDIVCVGWNPAKGWRPRTPGDTEWGFVFETLDPTRRNFGQVTHPLATDWEATLKITAPAPDAPGRFDHVAAFVRTCPDKYVMGNMGISGFGTMTAIRGFSELLEGLYTDPERVLALAEMVFAFERGMIRQFARHGVQAIAFWDDWGTQQSLMIAPGQWREIFRPLYQRHFALCHELGLHVFFHSCGQVTAIVNDLIEIGVDMLNLSQMTLYLEEVAAIGAGRTCFVCPVDFQRTLYAERETIKDQIGRLIKLFGHGGGIIGQTENYTHLGCDYEVSRFIADTFCEQGGRRPLHPATAGASV